MMTRSIFLSLALLSSVAGAAAEGELRKLSGSQISAKLGGMQFTDEVHWREVYEKGGTLRNYAMGHGRIGKWRVRSDELCIDLGSDGDNNCYQVWSQGNRIVMKREADDKYPNEGILEKPTDPAKTTSRAVR
jgi:hypothetical protein